MLPKNGVGAEIGVHTGDFSHRILRIARPRELHLIDPWQHETSETYARAVYGGGARGGQVEMDARYQRVCTRFLPQIQRGRVRVHRGRSSTVLRGFPDTYFDWVYIDGNHLYEFVKTDLELCWAKVRPHGYITGDDYGEGGWWQEGVVRAVDEFAGRARVQVILKRNRQFVLQRV